MNFRRTTARLAVAGVSTALAAGALVGTATTAAHAETGTSQYTCGVAGNNLPIVASVTADLPATSWQTHAPVPDLNLPINGAFVVPRAVLDALAGFNVHKVGVDSPTFGLELGTADIPLANVSSPLADVPATGNLTLPFTAVLHGFEMDTDAGHYDISMPASFVANIATDSLGTISDVTCTIADPATAGIVGFDVTKQSATIQGPKKVTGKRGKVVTVPVKVKGSSTTATGQVVASEAGKKVGTAKLKKGKAVLQLKKLGAGKHKITLSYAGDKNTVAATDVVVPVTVKK